MNHIIINGTRIEMPELCEEVEIEGESIEVRFSPSLERVLEPDKNPTPEHDKPIYTHKDMLAFKEKVRQAMLCKDLQGDSILRLESTVVGFRAIEGIRQALAELGITAEGVE